MGALAAVVTGDVAVAAVLMIVMANVHIAAIVAMIIDIVPLDLHAAVIEIAAIIRVPTIVDDSPIIIIAMVIDAVADRGDLRHVAAVGAAGAIADGPAEGTGQNREHA